MKKDLTPLPSAVFNCDKIVYSILACIKQGQISHASTFANKIFKCAKRKPLVIAKRTTKLVLALTEKGVSKENIELIFKNINED